MTGNNVLRLMIALSVIVQFVWTTNSTADTERGKKVYESRCAICHNSTGDGNGSIGIVEKAGAKNAYWAVYPRDLTAGVFKFRSTATGCLPKDGDLHNSIKNGIMRGGMPSHLDVSDKDIDAVVGYVKTLSERWKEESACEPVAVKKPAYVGTEASVTKGKEVFEKMKCWECHGKEGKGDGPKSDEIKDDSGKPILPFNFTSGQLKRGSSAENVYMTFTTGLDGTGMPSYEDSLNEEQRWNLVSYTLKLMKKIK
ncbi:MAG: c-type cytochrome [Candidatus Magnetominusculus sp. LBB02]|nr:c-type cytochrome [Candidatus Magnetominusculus sp. LBB02]